MIKDLRTSMRFYPTAVSLRSTQIDGGLWHCGLSQRHRYYQRHNEDRIVCRYLCTAFLLYSILLVFILISLVGNIIVQLMFLWTCFIGYLLICAIVLHIKLSMTCWVVLKENLIWCNEYVCLNNVHWDIISSIYMSSYSAYECSVGFHKSSKC